MLECCNNLHLLCKTFSNFKRQFCNFSLFLESFLLGPMTPFVILTDLVLGKIKKMLLCTLIHLLRDNKCIEVLYVVLGTIWRSRVQQWVFYRNEEIITLTHLIFCVYFPSFLSFGNFKFSYWNFFPPCSFPFLFPSSLPFLPFVKSVSSPCCLPVFPLVVSTCLGSVCVLSLWFSGLSVNYVN